MNRVLATFAACAFGLLASTASMAWKVDWSNHRSIKVHILNMYTEEIRVLGYDYQCVDHKPEPVNIAPNGATGTSEFEWKQATPGCDNGDQWKTTLALGIRGQDKQVCVITLTTSAAQVLNGQVNNFQAETNHSSNCKIDISADPNDPRDNITVLVKSTATPRTPVPRPTSKYWSSDKCDVVLTYAPQCAPDWNTRFNGESCVYSDCRACPKKGATLDGYYVFKFSFLQTSGDSNLKVGSCE